MQTLPAQPAMVDGVRRLPRFSTIRGRVLAVVLQHLGLPHSQEVLTNVALHAHATNVRVLIRTDEDGLSLIVQDNGQGLQPGDLLKPQAMGVLGMRERAVQLGGTLTVAATPGKGTRVALTLPIIGRAASGSRSQ